MPVMQLYGTGIASGISLRDMQELTELELRALIINIGIANGGDYNEDTCTFRSKDT